MLREIAFDFRSDLPVVASRSRRLLGRFLSWLSAVRVDILIAILAAIATAGVTYGLASRVPPEMYDPANSIWAWFNGDMLRVQSSMLSRAGDHFRTQVHPLASIIMFTPTKILLDLGLSPASAILTYLVTMSGLWSAAIYSGLRGLTLARPDALIFTLFATVTASAMFWLPITEVYSTAGFTVAATLALGTLIYNKRLPLFLQACASALSFSITTTNWMAGIWVTLCGNDYRRAIRITFDALLIVTILFGIQKMLIPRTQFFVPNLRLEWSFMMHESSVGIVSKLRSFWLYSIAAPIPTFPYHLENDGLIERYLSFQRSSLWDMRWTGLIGLFLWLPVLALGTFVAIFGKIENSRIAQAILLFVASQCAFHALWGDETFLYSMNYLPGIVLLGALACLTSARKLVLAAILISSVCLAVHNVRSYEDNMQFVRTYTAQEIARKVTGYSFDGEIDGY